MAWSYYCADDKMTVTAQTKEELATKMVQHMQQRHEKSISYDQAMQMVNQNAKQSAA